MKYRLTHKIHLKSQSMGANERKSKDQQQQQQQPQARQFVWLMSRLHAYISPAFCMELYALT